MGVDTEKITAELKLLNWHKLANEAALKAALIKTKQIKEKDAKKTPQSTSLKEQAEWMQRVIEEEQAKPLQVSKEFVTDYKEREKREEERLENEVDRHILALKRVKAQVAQREKMRAKREYYKRGKAQLLHTNTNKTNQEEILPMPQEEKPGGTLTSVISSLDRLVDLERRIASLEKDAIYDRVTQATPAVSDHKKPMKKQRLKFTKQKIPLGANRPSKQVYSVCLGQHTNRKKRTDAVSKRYIARSNRGFRARQDQAINSWLENKNSSLQSRGTKGHCRKALQKNSNNARQQFIDMKRNIEKRKDTLRKAQSKQVSKQSIPKINSRRGQKSTSNFHQTQNRRSCLPHKNNGPSKRAPPIHPAAPNKRNVPNRSLGISRPSNAATNSLPLPHIAGSGVRVIRGVRSVSSSSQSSSTRRGR